MRLKIECVDDFENMTNVLKYNDNYPDIELILKPFSCSFFNLEVLCMRYKLSKDNRVSYDYDYIKTVGKHEIESTEAMIEILNNFSIYEEDLYFYNIEGEVERIKPVQSQNLKIKQFLEKNVTDEEIINTIIKIVLILDKYSNTFIFKNDIEKLLKNIIKIELKKIHDEKNNIKEHINNTKNIKKELEKYINYEEILKDNLNLYKIRENNDNNDMIAMFFCTNTDIEDFVSKII